MDLAPANVGLGQQVVGTVRLSHRALEVGTGDYRESYQLRIKLHEILGLRSSMKPS